MKLILSFYHPNDKRAAERLSRASYKNFCALGTDRFDRLSSVLELMKEEFNTRETGFEDVVRSALDIFFIEFLRQGSGSGDGTSVANSYVQERFEELLSLLELPCNRQTPYSHNFLTNDGSTPKDIAALARLQVGHYPTVSFLSGRVISGKGDENAFEVYIETREIYSARKLIFATGIRDILAPIDGLAACWGISVIHCPYCHEYEVKAEPTGLLSNGEVGFDFARMISNWTADLTLFTNGISILSGDQQAQLARRGIAVVEKEISMLEQDNGQLRNVLFTDGSVHPLKVLYAPGSFEQHCKVPEEMGCELTEEGYIKVDGFGETTLKGVYAVGDNASKMRTIANAVAMGTAAGMVVSKLVGARLYLPLAENRIVIKFL